MSYVLFRLLHGYLAKSFPSAIWPRQDSAKPSHGNRLATNPNRALQKSYMGYQKPIFDDEHMQRFRLPHQAITCRLVRIAYATGKAQLVRCQVTVRNANLYAIELHLFIISPLLSCVAIDEMESQDNVRLEYLTRFFPFRNLCTQDT
nr:hypothetical protein [Edaphobacter dinghuensis]